MNNSGGGGYEEFYSELVRRIIRDASETIKATRADCASWKSRIAPNMRNNLGVDVEPGILTQIEKLFAGQLTNLSPWQEAQLRELAFWRWVAFEGYAGMPPEMFPFHQEHFMVATYQRTGWARQRFVEKSVFELGSGPLGMIEYLPARQRFAYDPLSKHYGRLFANCRSKQVTHASKPDELIELRDVDFAICHNVIDHTEDPAWWFNTLFEKLKLDGDFLFQVNLSRRDVPQQDEHRRMHPSPFERGQILQWLEAKSNSFQIYEREEASEDGEFYFLAWGKKTRDSAVEYHHPGLSNYAANA